MKKYRLIALGIFIYCAAFVTSGCSDENCNPKLTEGCICPAVFDPVCGCDDVTYGNACEATCNNIAEYTKGSCQ